MSITKSALALAVTLFAANIAADTVYQGFADGNPDLFVYSRESVPAVGIQPGVGDSFDLYHGLADGNSELFSPVQDDKNHGPRPDIYGNFGPTGDLSY
ncbi:MULTISPECIES: hypothetical protein [unclassified Thiocapsa]|uniref:hypothetical protein n=1 Tax=unclassified Thiocapsa TaxID=2641286 RepID=UPI0035B268EC